MSKVFSKNQGPAVSVKRNTFDLSHACHLTAKIGKLVPVYCEEVLPGDSFRIRPQFGLRFNPLLFPIQSRYHGIMHFFYVRNRNLFDKWQEYIGRTDSDAVLPYRVITEANAKSQIGTKSLGDYLGIPSTVTGLYSNQYYMKLQTYLPAASSSVQVNQFGSFSVDDPVDFSDTALSTINRLTPNRFIFIPSDSAAGLTSAASAISSMFSNGVSPKVSQSFGFPVTAASLSSTYGYWCHSSIDQLLKSTKIVFDSPTNLGSSNFTMPHGAFLAIAIGDRVDTPLAESVLAKLCPIALKFVASTSRLEVTNDDNGGLSAFVNEYVGSRSVYVGVFFTESSTSVQSPPSVLPTDATNFRSVGRGLIAECDQLTNRDATSDSFLPVHPYVLHGSDTEPKTRISALPFRAYESIYNYFYRDETIDPLIVNGKEIFNDFIRSHSGGADSLSYNLFSKNWERDYFTSCQKSPQQGIAPLVGISANGTFTFDDGTNQYTAQMTIGDDGETITGISTYSPDMPKGSLRQLMDVVTNGISINDLRNVNSFQRWLETNIRRGYKYVDQIYSHYGVNPAFKANDMPEFIGGIHTIGDVMPVVNQSAQGLGQYGANITMIGNSQNDIHKFCDEHGYIIGIMCVFPEPVYSQMMPKHFLKTQSPLDYFFPEFGHIGMQPISYNEVCPLEVAAYDAAHGTDSLNSTFGYQRAWAEYLSHNDSIHGDFRLSLSDYVVSRVFKDKPELGHDFIAIDEGDINDVFVTTDDSDVVKGQIRFEISAQRPIPQFGIPRLE